MALLDIMMLSWCVQHMIYTRRSTGTKQGNHQHGAQSSHNFAVYRLSI